MVSIFPFQAGPGIIKYDIQRGLASFKFLFQTPRSPTTDQPTEMVASVPMDHTHHAGRISDGKQHHCNQHYCRRDRMLHRPRPLDQPLQIKGRVAEQLYNVLFNPHQRTHFYQQIRQPNPVSPRGQVPICSRLLALISFAWKLVLYTTPPIIHAQRMTLS